MRAGIVIGPLLTACLFAFIAIIIIRQPWGRKYAGWLPFTLLMLFIPSSIFSAFLTVSLLDWIDIREFKYSDVSEMKYPDRYYIPPNAKQIDLYCRGSGHVARFTISPEALAAWIKQLRATKPDFNIQRSDVGQFHSFGSADVFRNDFSSTSFPTADWKYESSMRRYDVTLAANGAGFAVWQAPESQVAYLRAFYW